MEKGGDVREPINFFARALPVVGEIQALELLLDTPNDETGLTLVAERVPQNLYVAMTPRLDEAGGVHGQPHRRLSSDRGAR